MCFLQTRAGPREKEEWGQRLKEVGQDACLLVCTYCLCPAYGMLSINHEILTAIHYAGDVIGVASLDQVHTTEQSNRLRLVHHHLKQGGDQMERQVLVHTQPAQV